MGGTLVLHMDMMSVGIAFFSKRPVTEPSSGAIPRPPSYGNIHRMRVCVLQFPTALWTKSISSYERDFPIQL
jgi:hypothetical protein